MERGSGVGGVREEEAGLGLGDQDETEKNQESCTRHMANNLGIQCLKGQSKQPLFPDPYPNTDSFLCNKPSTGHFLVTSDSNGYI